jgi:hypothetical protein
VPRAAFAGQVLFGEHGVGLSDGTAADTRLLPGLPRVTRVVGAVGGRILYCTQTASFPWALHSLGTDGSLQHLPNPAREAPTLVTTGNLSLLVGDDCFRTDGTAAGTAPFLTGCPGGVLSCPAPAPAVRCGRATALRPAPDRWRPGSSRRCSPSLGATVRC